MKRLRSLRLAQFWRIRLEPLLRNSDEQRFSPGEAFEAIGWLVEGVFCGFFDAEEANIIWVRIRSVRKACDVSSPPRATEALCSEIRRLGQSSEPFRQSLQMPEGPQRNFELPLFPHTLLLSNRFFSDQLARTCISLLCSQSQNQWLEWKSSWSSVSASQVEERLADPQNVCLDLASLAAGYFRVLEHMEASRSFFQYVKARSPRGRDFDSYCQRIGGLNAWRLPLQYPDVNRRFADLSELLEFTIRPELVKRLPDAAWSEFQHTFSRHLSSVVDAWESQHLSAALATA